MAATSTVVPGGQVGRTESSLFIIESLDFQDEKLERFEGQILKQILALSGKTVEYRYIRTRRELPAVLEQFHQSRMRYLHISCHGRRDALATTLDVIKFPRFGDLVRPYLNERRLFVSACEATNRSLAREVLCQGSGCRSLVGPVGEIYFNDAAIVWAAFYHLMFKHDSNGMKRRTISDVLRQVCATFSIPMQFFYPDTHSSDVEGKAFGPDGEPLELPRHSRPMSPSLDRPPDLLPAPRNTSGPRLLFPEVNREG